MTTRAAFLVMALLLSGCSASGPVTPYLYDNGPDYLSEGLMRICQATTGWTHKST